MAARAAVQSLLEELLQDGHELQELGFQTSYASNSIDTPPEEKFIIVRWEDNQQSFGSQGTQMLSIWLHVRDQDYTDIDKGLEVIKWWMGEVVHRAGDDNWILTQADWRGDSPDLIDDGFKTLTRNSSFEVVSRYATTEI